MTPALLLKSQHHALQLQQLVAVLPVCAVVLAQISCQVCIFNVCLSTGGVCTTTV